MGSMRSLNPTTLKRFYAPVAGIYALALIAATACSPFEVDKAKVDPVARHEQVIANQEVPADLGTVELDTLKVTKVTRVKDPKNEGRFALKVAINIGTYNFELLMYPDHIAGTVSTAQHTAAGLTFYGEGFFGDNVASKAGVLIQVERASKDDSYEIAEVWETPAPDQPQVAAASEQRLGTDYTSVRQAYQDLTGGTND